MKQYSYTLERAPKRVMALEGQKAIAEELDDTEKVSVIEETLGEIRSYEKS